MGKAAGLVPCNSLLRALVMVHSIGFFCGSSNAQQPLQVVGERMLQADIAGLGEESHGYATFNTLKASIVSRLHEQRKDGELVFESSFTQGMAAYLLQYPLDKRMEAWLYPFWNTPEVGRALQSFVTKEEEKQQPFLLGCDVQEDCRYVVFSQMLQQRQWVSRQRALLEKADSVLQYYIGADYSRAVMNEEEVHLLHGWYDSIAVEIRGTVADSLALLLVERCLQNRKWLCEYLSLKASKKRMYFRDSIMAVNVLWLKEHLFNKSPVWIWAANSHVARRKLEGKAPQWMGEWLQANPHYSYYAAGLQRGGQKRKERPGNTPVYDIRFSSQGKFDAVIFHPSPQKIAASQWKTRCP